MLYGFIDESGAPGAATSHSDYVGIAMVLLSDLNAVERAIAAIQDFRRTANLPADYEFHLSRNSLIVQRSFLDFLATLDFRYIFIPLRKTALPQDASFAKLAGLLLQTADALGQDIIIRMDDNPVLFAELKKYSKRLGLRIKCKQTHSKNNDLVQLADYIVSMSMRDLKGRRVPDVWTTIAKTKRLK